MPRLAFDGHELDWEARGDGRPMLFVHGLTFDRRVMIETFEPLLDGAPVRRIYLDLPGHGASRGNRAKASADDLVRGAAAVAREAAGGATLAVVGHSYGGYLAQGLVRELGAVDGLFLVCPVVEPDVARRRVGPRLIHAEKGLVFVNDFERTSFEEIAVVQTAAALDQFRRVVHPAQLAVDRDFLAATRDHYAFARPCGEWLRDLDAPVGIVCGREDGWVGWEDPADLLKLIRRAQLTVVPGAGNLLPLEAPASCARAFAEWLARL